MPKIFIKNLDTHKVVEQQECPAGTSVYEALCTLLDVGHVPERYLGFHVIHNTDLVDHTGYRNRVLEDSDELTILPAPKDPGTAALIISIVSTAYAIYVYNTLPDINQAKADAGSRSVIYDANFQSNKIRLGEAVPAIFGTMPVYPDYVGQPYKVYENNQAVFYGALLAGTPATASGNVATLGYSLSVDNTPLSDIDGSQYITRNENSSRFSLLLNAVTIPEIGQIGEGRGLPIWYGDSQNEPLYPLPFWQVFPPSVPAADYHKVWISILAPNGIWSRDKSTGGYGNAILDIFIGVSERGDTLNNPNGGLSTVSQSYTGTGVIHKFTYTENTQDERGITNGVDVSTFVDPVVRVEAYVNQNAGFDYPTDFRLVGGFGTFYTTDPAGVRSAFLECPRLPNWEGFEARIPLTKYFAESRSNRINVLVGENLAGVLSPYPSGRTVNSLDLSFINLSKAGSFFNLLELSSVDTELLAAYNRGVRFNHVYDSFTTIGEVLQQFLQVCGTILVPEAGKLVMRYEGVRSTADAYLNEDSILASGVEESWKLQQPETDSYRIEYFDKVEKKVKTVEVPPAEGRTAFPQNPKTIRLAGVTDELQAARYGAKEYFIEYLRRKSYKLSTELAGGLLTPTDRVSVKLPDGGNVDILVSEVSPEEFKTTIQGGEYLPEVYDAENWTVLPPASDPVWSREVALGGYSPINPSTPKYSEVALTEGFVATEDPSGNIKLQWSTPEGTPASIDPGVLGIRARGDGTDLAAITLSLAPDQYGNVNEYLYPGNAVVDFLVVLHARNQGSLTGLPYYRAAAIQHFTPNTPTSTQPKTLTPETYGWGGEIAPSGSEFGDFPSSGAAYALSQNSWEYWESRTWTQIEQESWSSNPFPHFSTKATEVSYPNKKTVKITASATVTAGAGSVLQIGVRGDQNAPVVWHPYIPGMEVTGSRFSLRVIAYNDATAAEIFYGLSDLPAATIDPTLPYGVLTGTFTITPVSETRSSKFFRISDLHERSPGVWELPEEYCPKHLAYATVYIGNAFYFNSTQAGLVYVSTPAIEAGLNNAATLSLDQTGAREKLLITENGKIGITKAIISFAVTGEF